MQLFSDLHGLVSSRPSVSVNVNPARTFTKKTVNFCPNYLVGWQVGVLSSEFLSLSECFFVFSLDLLAGAGGGEKLSDHFSNTDLTVQCFMWELASWGPSYTDRP